MGSTFYNCTRMTRSLATLVGLLAVISCTANAVQHVSRREFKTTVDMIVEAGYPAEQHQITTEDCYKITLHRIPGPGKPVFLQHGLIDSSAAWVIAGPEHGGLAFRLAQEGYDVWLGNYRGNIYSRDHCTLLPDKDQEYWKFSWDEMAHYDLPASLNFVLNHTGAEKLFYVGHSMGSTTYLVMNSLDQSWADRVELATFFAPVAYVDHMVGPLKYIAPFSFAVEWVADHLGMGEFVLSDWLQNLLATYVCDEESWLEAVCENVVFLICGYDHKQMNETMLPVIIDHLPAGTSTYTVLQYAQEINTKTFSGFDWGSPEANIAHHGEIRPPLYNLSNVNTPIALFFGDNDWLVASGDMMKIVTECQDVIVGLYEVAWQGWNHLDFLYAIDVNKFVNEPFIETLKSFQ